MSSANQSPTSVRNVLRCGAAAAALALGWLACGSALAEQPVLGPAPEAPSVEATAPADGDAALVPAEGLEVATEAATEPADAPATPAVVADPIAAELAVLTAAPDVPPAIADFYASRGQAPVWVGAEGLNAQGDELIATLRDAAADGLNPDDYLHDPVLSRIDAVDPRTQAELDLHLTRAFLDFGGDLMNGRFRQAETTATVRDHEDTVDLTQPLRYAIDSGTIGETLRGLAPPHEQYHTLRAALAQYRQLSAGGSWEQIPELESNLEQGVRHAAIPAIRARLAATGEYTPPAEGVADDRLYDAGLADAVRLFQQRNGLLADAVVGPRTLAMLNGSLDYRIRQIEASMERWRWYPRDLGSKYVMVNVPEFMVRGYDSEGEPLEMRVIVGTADNQTPIFSDRMEYATVNPYWHVPQSIADEEYLPALRRDPFYLLNQNIRILSGGQEINPILVDWAAMGNNFPYAMRQEPGAGNALGRIKFMFPNRHAVYLHDTPTRSLFERAVRSFSHGCIRLQDPMAMAGFVFRGQMTVEQVEAAIASGRTRDIVLDRTIPVYITYFPARVDENGVVNFFSDIYQRDEALIQAMDASAPPPPTVVAETVVHQGPN